MTSSWQGKVALITGASSGIGAATARRLAAQGLQVILVARRLERLKVLANEIRTAGGQAEVLTTDLGQESDRLKLVADVERQFGCPDVLVNNAGFAYYGYTADMPWETAQAMIDVNATAAAHLTHRFLPGMLERHSGHIIIMGSVNGVMPSQGTALYSASKAFLSGFTTALFRELAGSGVAISVVLPGPVATEIFDNSEKIKNGFRIPAESGAISAETVASTVWSLLLRPRRYVFVPWYWRWTAFAEFFFGWAMDLAGPILLRRINK
jgi:short-subunit dehydrogenase